MRLDSDSWIPIDLALLRKSMLAADEVVYVWDVRQDHYTWSENAALVLGLRSDELPANQDGFLRRMGPDDVPARVLAMSGQLDTVPTGCRQFKFRRSDGGYEWLEERLAVHHGPKGMAERVLGRLCVVSERHRGEADLERLAFYDDLTGFANRRRISAEIDAAICRCGSGDGGAGFVLINIDGLGLLNSTYGFELGDSVIVEVGSRIDRCAGALDLVGRVGGNQFGVLLGDCSPECMESFADRVLGAVRDGDIVTDVGPIAVTVTLGGVLLPEDAGNARVAFGLAEESLSSAKQAGRDRFVRFVPSEYREADRRRAFAAGDSVLTALRDRRLLLAMQPIVDGRNGEPRFYECLMRMMDEAGEVIPAGAFMPVVEKLGIIRKLDMHALELALHELSEDPGLNLSVNVSGITATDPTMLARILGIVRAHASLADRLVVEITETAAMRDFAETGRFTSLLRDLGCRIAIDDFGAGYTSFRHLTALAVDMVKIDGQYVRGLPEDPKNMLFVDTFLSLARGMGVEVVAECVETEAQADVLRERGVDFLQGYLFGGPSIRRPWLQQPTAAAV